MVRDPRRQLVVADLDFFLLGHRVDDERTERAFLCARANLVGAVAHPFGRVLARHPRADQRTRHLGFHQLALAIVERLRHFDRVALDHEVEQSLARAQRRLPRARAASAARAPWRATRRAMDVAQVLGEFVVERRQILGVDFLDLRAPFDGLAGEILLGVVGRVAARPCAGSPTSAPVSTSSSPWARRLGGNFQEALSDLRTFGSGLPSSKPSISASARSPLFDPACGPRPS